MSDPIYLSEYDGLIREVLASGGEFRLYPHGTSMLPLLRQGRDSVALRRLDRAPQKWDILFYQRWDGSYVLQTRGKTVGVDGEWRPRTQKHRYMIVYDKSLSVKWVEQPYPKAASTSP